LADVFVSYARSDEPQAKRVAKALADEGYRVWRDDELPAHRAYADVIEERLRAAEAVVVLWSAEAAKSQWVRAEADAARSGDCLIQVSIDGTIPPLPFNQIQCADLGGWNGDKTSPGWRKLVASVRALTGKEDSSNERSELMAWQYWIDGDFGESGRERRVIRICERITAIDPDYAQAWALMGLAQANLRYAYSGNEELDNGLEAANRALSLDPSIAEAHLPRAWHFAMLGKDHDAREELETALQLNPDSWEANKEAARIFCRQNDLPLAAQCLEKATSLSESDFHSRGMLSAMYLGQGDVDKARACAAELIRQVEGALSRNPDNGAALAYGALSFAAVGNIDRARDWIERALLLDPENMYMRYNLAWPVLGFMDDKELALDLLGPALAKGGRNLVTLAQADRNLDPLRTDKRFCAMMEAAAERVGLTSANPAEA